jgi:hypothetical protein
MAIVTRLGKGSKLTTEEMDNNLLSLETDISSNVSAITSKLDKGTYTGSAKDLDNAIAASVSAITSKLDKGTYTGTAKDLENAIVAAVTGASGISIVPTSPAPSGTGIASFTATQAGTYTNYGGLVVNANSFAVISRSAAGVFSISQTALDISSKFNVSDLIDNLTTDSATKAVNARQSKKLNDRTITKVVVPIIVGNVINPAENWKMQADASWKSNNLRPLKNVDSIEAFGVNTYHSGQNSLFFASRAVDTDTFTTVSITYRNGDFTIPKSEFPAGATHYTINAIASISPNMAINEYQLPTDLFYESRIAKIAEVNAERKIAERDFFLPSILDVTKYVVNRSIETIQGREIPFSSGYLSDFCPVELNVTYIGGYIVTCYMYGADKSTYLGQATLVANNTFTITNADCFFIRIISPNNIQTLTRQDLGVTGPYGKMIPLYGGGKKMSSINRYKKPIQGFGDSIIARGDWFVKMTSLIGHQATTFTYGGTNSSLIRHQMTLLADTNGNQIAVIWVGHNNIASTQTIINDIRMMVRLRQGDTNFLVITPPSGTYSSGANTITFINDCKKLEAKLEAIYGSRCLNMRKALVSGGYDMGDIKLTQSFVQPALNSNVNVYVNDVPFMTYINSAETGMVDVPNQNLFKIGIDGIYDEYQIISSVITSGTVGYLTAKLVVNNRITPTNTVGDLSVTATPAGASPITYTAFVEVIKSADKYVMDTYETTPPTSRADGVHPNNYGGKCEGELIAYRISALNVS